ncbi:MAG: hypothetical protein ACP6IP_03130 [Candidatus Njordarchaeia archaeon]
MSFVIKEGNIYEPLEIKNESEFQKIIFEELLDQIFMEDTLQFEPKYLESEIGGSKADGYVILPNSKDWAVIEVELSYHDPTEHIASQIMKIDSSVSDENKNKLEDYFIKMIEDNPSYKAKLVENGYETIAKRKEFIRDLVEKKPLIVIFLERSSGKIEKALEKIKVSNAREIKIVVIRIFYRSGCKDCRSDFIYYIERPLYSLDLKNRLKAFINNLSENQRKFLEILCKKNDWVYIDEIAKLMGLSSTRAIAGFRSGMTRQERKLNLGPIIKDEFDKTKGSMKYKIEAYYKFIKAILKC